MEINKYTDIVGAVATQDIVEGRMVLITAANASHDFGSRTDLPGVKLPANSTEAARAKFVLAFPVDNRPLPLVETYPSFSFALRGGWDQASNVPFQATIHLTHQANAAVPQTLYSGNLAAAFDRGVFTTTSGNFVASESLVPGAHLVVCNVADDGATDAGKLKYSATAGVAIVERYDATNGKLTFRTL